MDYMDLKQKAHELPKQSGVYLFKNNKNIVIYVGKAKNINKRVASYFAKQKKDWKVQLLIDESSSIDCILTTTEHEALLLEAELVQRYQPKYNVLLKSGQPFIFLIVTEEDLPTLKLQRTKSASSLSFGPFIYKQQARNVYEYLITTFKLYLCNKSIENGCLDYHLGKCSGICTKRFDKEDYLFRLGLAIDVLQNNSTTFIKKIDEKIKEYSKKLEFEKAKNLYQYQKNVVTIFNILKKKFDFSKYQEKILNITTTIEADSIKNYEKTGIELQKMLALPTIPNSIDCFDISHFQSHAIVGSCIRFLHGKPDQKSFRKFKIKTLVIQNDYAALYEAVSRRYKNLKNMPDLVLIDGGKGQRNAVLSLIPSEKCISLAKKEEMVFSNNYPEGIHLNLKTNIGKLLISIRDYAHHFAITYHKTLRSKKFTRGD